jgi:hypothetical protein
LVRYESSANLSVIGVSRLRAGAGSGALIDAASCDCISSI